MTDHPDERTAPSQRHPPEAQEPVERTVLSRRQAPAETTEPFEAPLALAAGEAAAAPAEPAASQAEPAAVQAEPDAQRE